MLDQKNRVEVKPFVVAFQESGTQANKVSDPKTRRAKSHMGKEEATRAVLNRIVARVKRI
jgi:hypothetical protein